MEHGIWTAAHALWWGALWFEVDGGQRGFFYFWFLKSEREREKDERALWLLNFHFGFFHFFLKAHTEAHAKELIVQASGCRNDGLSWEKSFAGETGGVVTIQSELGEPIHKLYTRGMALWKQIDETLLSIQDRGELKKQVLAKKRWLVDRMNADFQKPFFGRKLDG